MSESEKSAIYITCDKAFVADVKDVAMQSHEGNVARFSRESIRTAVKLRRLYGPRYELVISELIDGAEAEKALAA